MLTQRMVPWHILSVGVTVTLSAAILAFYFADIGDPDLYWHLRTGEWIVAHRALPSTDPFLATQGATPWVLHEWLFEVLLHSAHVFAGFVGVRALVALFQGATLLVLWRSMRRELPEVPATLLVLGCAAAILPYASPRPHLVTLLMVAVWASVLAAVLRGESDGRLWWLPALMVPWVNAHGGYILGLVLIVLAALALWMAATPNSRAGAAPPRGRQLVLVFAACVLATAVNPYGFGHLLFPLRVLTMWMGPLIDEWAPLTLRSPAFGAFIVMLAVFLMAQIYRRSPPGPSGLVLPAAMVLLAVSAGRHAPLATMVLAVFAAPALNDGAWARFAVAWGARTRPTARPGDLGLSATELGPAQYALNALLLAALAIATWLTLPAQDAWRMEKANATIGWKAVDVLARAGFTGRCFNAYGFGGYFTYRMWPRSKAYIDGRPDMYPDAFARDYVRMAAGAEGWREVFDREQFDCIVVPRALPLRQLVVERGGFEEVFSDRDNVLMIRQGHPELASVRRAVGGRR